MWRRKCFLLGVVVLGLALFLSLLDIQKSSVSANHGCPPSGPFGGRAIDCTYYVNAPITHEPLQFLAAADWNWPNGYYNEGATPNPVHNNAADFIAWTRANLWTCGFHPANENSCPGSTAASRRLNWAKVIGDSFIVNTILGVPGSRFAPSAAPPYNTYMPGGVAYAQDNFTTWSNRISEYDAAGLVDWNVFLTHAQIANIPGPQCGGSGGRSDTVVYNMGGFGTDEAIYNNTNCGSASYISFRHPTTRQPIYRINRNCGNVTGDLAALPPLPPRDFKISPNANVTVAPDDENPASATFSSGATVDFGAPVRSDLSWRYFIRRSNGAEQTLPGGSGTTNRLFTSTPFSQQAIINLVGQNLQAGDQVCSTASITPSTGQANSAGTVISPPPYTTASMSPVCVRIVNRPYSKVYGGDVFAGAGFEDSATGLCRVDNEAHVFGINRGSNPYTGAGSQLATFALGLIFEFATGQVRTNATDPNALSFANTGNAAGDGHASSVYGGGLHEDNAICAPDYYAAVSGAPGGNVINPTTPANTTTTTQSSGDVVIQPGALAPGAKRTVYVNGNVFITGNITYASAASFGSAQQIPSFRLIVRGNIYVDPSVSQLDGLYIAQSDDANNDGDVDDVNFANPTAGDGQGRFYTCGRQAWASRTPRYAPNPTDMNDAVSGCRARRLTVVGAVIAESVKLTRSPGTRLQSTVAERYNSGGNPAEVFIFSPEAWLNGEFPGTGEFDSVTALPPVL